MIEFLFVFRLVHKTPNMFPMRTIPDTNIGCLVGPRDKNRQNSFVHLFQYRTLYHPNMFVFSIEFLLHTSPNMFPNPTIPDTNRGRDQQNSFVRLFQ